MSSNLRKAIRYEANLEKLKKQLIKFKRYVSSCEKWIRTDKKGLSEILKQLSKEDHLEYQYKCGFIEHADYVVIKQKMEEKE